MTFDIKEFSKRALIKFLWFLVLFLVIEALLLGVIEVLTIFLENSITDISSDFITNQLAYTYQNPITMIQTYINESNPLFLIGTLANAISCFVALFKRSQRKKKGWQSQSEGYHGSAHWATKAEILDHHNFNKANKNAVAKAFNQSLGEENEE